MAKTKFVVKESKFSSRVKSRWRYPRGKHSKVRQQHKGRPAMPQPGYGSSAATKGLHPLGKYPVVISTKSQLESLADNEGAVFSANLGMRKRQELLTLAKEKGLTLLNVANIDEALSTITKALEERKKSRAAKMKKKAAKKEDKKEKKQDKKSKESPKETTDTKTDKEKEKEMAQKTIIKPQ